MVMYSFHLEDFEKWLAGFATRLDATLHDRILTIPSRLGDGIIMARNINTHFSYAIMNFKLTNDLEMHRETGSKGFIITFNQVDAHKDSAIGLPSHAVSRTKSHSSGTISSWPKPATAPACDCPPVLPSKDC